MAELPQVTPEQIKQLRKRMALSQEQFAAMLRVTRPFVGRLETGAQAVEDTALRVLIRWLMSVYGVEGGEPPHPEIPIVLVRRPG